MLYSGNAFTLRRDGDVLLLHFDAQDAKVNVLNRPALDEFGQVLIALEAENGASGLIFTSGKSVFIAGADITEFLGYFNSPPEALAAMLDEVNTMFNRLESLPYPSIALINGDAQGGGFEVCLACDFRVMTPTARVGLPEVKLGIMPGWGGSVRLSRLIGVDNALEWMCLGTAQKAAVALAHGAVDAVVAPGQLEAAARGLIEQCADGRIELHARRAVKTGPLELTGLEAAMAFESARGVVAAQAGPHYPSPMTIIEAVEKHGPLSRDAALKEESQRFVTLAHTPVAASLVGIFLKDQGLKRLGRQQSKTARPVKQTAVLGAGIMGGGVAYQSASSGVPILMKDIREEAIELGLKEAGKLLQKQIERGKLKPDGMVKVLNAIRPTLSYGEFGSVDLVVEAVVENPKVKEAVLAEVEGHVREDAILTTNTSTISVNRLAKALKRPQNFCGMHFFNPVHRMPLVEIIRADTSSEEAIATSVAYALAMKKTPVVVNDCPGFLVNRILFAYFGGFNKLVADGAEPAAVDKVMERFGWPMGPAYLLDVVGMDTAKHAADVISEGFPDRMSSSEPTIIDALYGAERLGQKNGKGFYRYEMDRKGKPKKRPDAEADALVTKAQAVRKNFEPDTIIDRLMIPMVIESARCLEDDIVGTAAEVDMGLVYGIGFPPFRGGALQYADTMGLADFCARADALADLGPLYQPTKRMRAMASGGDTFHSFDGGDPTGSATVKKSGASA